MSHLFILRKL